MNKIFSKRLCTWRILFLVCTDLFHQPCLDRYAQSLPQHTAPAGFRCPKCKVCRFQRISSRPCYPWYHVSSQDHLFPPANMASPVAERLRNVLRSFNWAREGLGLQNTFPDDTSELKPSSSGLLPFPLTLVFVLSNIISLSLLGRDSPDFDFPSLVTSTPVANHSASSSSNLTASQHHPHTHSPHISLQLYEHPVNRGGE